MRRVVAALAAALLGIGSVVAGSPGAHADPPSVIHVVGSNPADAPDCGSPSFACKTIQYAVDSAASGDIVEVDASDGSAATYSESVAITKAITLTSGPNVTLTGVVTVGDAGWSATTTLTGLHFADGGGVVVDTDTGTSVVSDNSFTDVTGTAITLANSATEPMPVTLTGNTGTVTAPAATISEVGPVTVSAPTINTIATDPAPPLTASAGSVKIVPGAAGRQIASAGMPNGGSPLPTGQYDITMTSSDSIDATDLAMSYTDGTGTHSLPLSGSTAAGGTIMGSLAYPSHPGDLTFDLAGRADAATGTLHVAFDLNEYDANRTPVNHLASAALTVDDVADDGPSYGDRTVYLHADGAPTAVDISAADADSDQLAYTVVDAPNGGALTGGAPHLIYTPNAASTADSFTYHVSDGYVTGQTATVTLLPNNLPAAPDVEETVHGVGSTTFSLGPATDIADGGQPLTYSITTALTQGIATVSGTNVTYTPSVDSTGSDSIGYAVSDGVDTASGTITVTVNQAPAVQTFGATVKHAGATTITLGPANEPNGTALIYSITAQPGHASDLTLAGNQVSYIPATGYTGVDSFAFAASDGIDTVDATVNVTVNNAPVVTPQSAEVHHSGPTTITVGPPVDGDAQTLMYKVKTGPSHGGLGTFTGNEVAYTPIAGYTGADSFVVTASDGIESVDATISVTVNALPDVSPVTARVHNTGPTTFKLGPATDTDGQTITYTVTTPQQHGTLTSPNANQITYTPHVDAPATDVFTVTATDDIDSVSARITLDINTVPVVSARSITTPFGRAASITLGRANDADGDVVRYHVTTPAHGSLKGAHGVFTYTPKAGFAGGDSFQYTAADKWDTSDAATVRVTVQKAPSALSLSLSPGQPTSAQHATLTVRVTSAGSRNGKVTVGSQSAQVKSGRATFTLALYSGGTHTVSARFNGTRSALAATATKSFTVTKVASSLSATTNPTAITARTTNAVLTVTIHAGPYQPQSGRISIDDQTNGSQRHLGGVTPSNGTAHFTLPRLALGQHDLQIRYAGSPYVAASTTTLIERVAAGS